MTKIAVAGKTYRTGRLDAMKQFHVARRLSELLAIMGTTALRLSVVGASREVLDDFLPLLAPLSQVLAKMSDEDSEYVIFNCLSVVERNEGAAGVERWAAVSTGAQLMFQDMDMPTMLRLVVEVVRDNMGDFLRGLGDGEQSPSP